MMKKTILAIGLACIMLLAACSQDQAKETKHKDEKETFTYQSEKGKVEVPKNPKRVVVLATFAGNVMALDRNIVGVDEWSKDNPRFKDKLKDAKVVSDEDVEKIAALKPDLIIGLSDTKNYDKLKEIAPTVTYTYGKLDYLEQHIEFGKLLNKEEEARDWVKDFKQRAQKAEKDIKANIGEDATVSVIESFDKQLYVFGDHWGRGTEVLYQALDLKMPEKVEKMVKKEGYYTLSQEVLPDYVGDYLVLSEDKDAEQSFKKTTSYQNIPAVKDDHVIEVDQKSFYFNDPISIDHQLDTFTKQLTK